MKAFLQNLLQKAGRDVPDQRPESGGVEGKAGAPDPVREAPENAAPTAPPVPREDSASCLAIELGEFISRIPPHLLVSGEFDVHRPLLFDMGVIANRLASGVSNISLAEIIERVPEIFNPGAQAEQSLQIRFPWQKVRELIAASEAAAMQGGGETLARKIRRRRDAEKQAPARPPAEAQRTGSLQISRRAGNDAGNVWFSRTKTGAPEPGADRPAAPQAKAPGVSRTSAPEKAAPPAPAIPDSAPALVELPKPMPEAISTIPPVPPTPPSAQAEAPSAPFPDLMDLAAAPATPSASGDADWEKKIADLALAHERELARLRAENGEEIQSLAAQRDAALAVKEAELAHLRQQHALELSARAEKAGSASALAQLKSELDVVVRETDLAAAKYAERLAIAAAEHQGAVSEVTAERDVTAQLLTLAEEAVASLTAANQRAADEIEACQDRVRLAEEARDAAIQERNAIAARLAEAASPLLQSGPLIAELESAQASIAAQAAALDRVSDQWQADVEGYRKRNLALLREREALESRLREAELALAAKLGAADDTAR